VTTGADGHG